ncbi:hypothetical protein ACFTAO_20870 [Paenibacillus rhizoplanae]
MYTNIKMKWSKSLPRLLMKPRKIYSQKYNQTKEDITFFVSMTDDGLAEELENESVALMTNPQWVPDFFWHAMMLKSKNLIAAARTLISLTTAIVMVIRALP